MKKIKLCLITLAVLLSVVIISVLCACQPDTGNTDNNKPTLSATYDTSHTIYDGDELDSLKPYLTVTYTDEQQATSQVTDFHLDGVLQIGESDIVLSYKGTSCVITVTVCETPLNYILNLDGKSYNVGPLDSDITYKNIKIRSTYNNLPVTTIDAYAFEDYSSITSVDIPDSITSIGAYAFHNCANLETVYWNATNCKVDGMYTAFKDCTKLSTVIIGDNVTNVPSEGFVNCSGLTSVTVGKGVTTIGFDAFCNCGSLETVYWNATACASAGSSTNPIFRQCSKLTTVVIGNNVTAIPNNTFYYCGELSNVYYKGDIAGWCNISFDSNYANPLSNGANLYIDNELVTELVIPATVTEIKTRAFYGCTSITSVTIGNSVTKIGERAFYYCSSLTSVIIPDSVTKIGERAFYYCSSLTSITIPNSVTSIGIYAFCGCGNLRSVTIPNGVTEIAKGTFASCDSLYNISIPDSVTVIGEEAFKSCYSLINLTIPSGVITIVDNAFANCYKLVEIYNMSSLRGVYAGSKDNGYVTYYAKNVYTPKKGNSKIVTTDDGYVFFDVSETSSNAYCLIGYVGNQKELILPDKYNGQSYKIYEYAFFNCSDLTSITIPATIKIIPDSAFSNCSSLTNIVIPDNVTSIGTWAFSNCSSLTSIVIPDNVTSIGSAAFYECSSLTSVTIGKRVTTIGDTAFSDCDNIETLYWNAINCTSGFCDSQNTIVIGEDVSEMHKSLFYHSNVKTVYWNATMCVYAGSYNASGLLNGTIFEHCSELTEVVIGDNVVIIPDYAFYDCSSLTSVTIGNNVKNIKSYAFFGCDGLTSVTIPDSVTSIGLSAFYGCSLLKTVYYKGTADDWANVNIGSRNNDLTRATRYYYSETEPALNSAGTAYNGNYWYYNDNNEIVVWVYNKENN